MQSMMLIDSFEPTIPAREATIPHRQIAFSPTPRHFPPRPLIVPAIATRLIANVKSLPSATISVAHPMANAASTL